MNIPGANHKNRKVGVSVLDDLYDCYYNELVLWADTLLNDMGMAEDLVQEMFVSFWEKGTDTRLESKGMRAYLYKTVRNRALRVLKKKGEKTVVLPDIPEMTAVWEEVDMTRQQLFDRVSKELEKLPPRSREVLECIHLKNMKYAETAEVLGISVATVKTLLVRSLKMIRKSLGDPAYLFYVLFFKRGMA